MCKDVGLGGGGTRVGGFGIDFGLPLFGDGDFVTRISGVCNSVDLVGVVSWLSVGSVALFVPFSLSDRLDAGTGSSSSPVVDMRTAAD